MNIVEPAGPNVVTVEVFEVSISEAQVIEALNAVLEPELRKPITELDMVRRIEIKGNDVGVVLVAKIEDDPVANDLAMAVRAAVASIGASRCDVHIEWMTDDERALLRARPTSGACRPRSRSRPSTMEKS